ncbi:polyketide synthase dehydratase domain-containing protein, partial [Mycobacterium ulcerans]
HPLLDTATELAENRGWVFTGRISPRTQPWLNEHAVESAVLFPGTGFVELALHVADRAGYSSVNELIVHTPLLLAGHDTADLQITVTDTDDMGRQSLNIHSRPHIGHDNTTTGDEQPEWVLHASAVLTAQTTDHNHLPLTPVPW